MTFDQVLKHYLGSERDAAYQLGVTTTTIKNWRKGGIPHTRQLLIAYMTNGKLKADKRKGNGK